jgi:glycosyl transferase family 25
MITCIIYIHLATRPDTLIREQLDRIGLPYERFDAIPHVAGSVGRGHSHLAVLRLARDREYANVLIIEDDFELIVEADEFNASIQRFFGLGLDYNVLMLSHSLVRSKPHCDFLLKVLEGRNASGYLVNSNYYDKLIGMCERAIALSEETGIHWVYANDMVSHKYQATDNWYCVEPKLARQRAGYSDNAGYWVAYWVDHWGDHWDDDWSDDLADDWEDNLAEELDEDLASDSADDSADDSTGQLSGVWFESVRRKWDIYNRANV